MTTPNTATFLERLLTFFRTAASITYDNTESGLAATDVQAAIDEIAGGGTLPSIAAQTILGNATTGSAQAVATAPQSFIFTDATSGAGNIRLKVAPQGYGAVSALATASNVNVDITLSENGSYDFFVLVRLKLVAGARRTVAARICGNRDSGTLTMEGTQVSIDLGGVATGITITLSATSGNLRVNVANASGSTVNGRVHAGWTIEDLITDPA